MNFLPVKKQKCPSSIKPLIDSYVERVTKAGLDGKQIMKDVYALKEKYEKQYK